MEPTDFWAVIIQLTAVMALTLVLEVRAMYERVRKMDQSRTRAARAAIALMYAATVLGLLYAFVTALNGMGGTETPQWEVNLVASSLIFTFFVLVVAPTIPLIQGFVEELPISQESINAWKLRRLKSHVAQEFDDADRRVRAVRLQALAAASKEVVESSRLHRADGGVASALRLTKAVDSFSSIRSAPSGVEKVKSEILDLLVVLDAGHDFTVDESKRWRLAEQQLRAAGQVPVSPE